MVDKNESHDDAIAPEDLDKIVGGLKTTKTNKELQEPITRIEMYGSTKEGEAPDSSPPTFNVS